MGCTSVSTMAAPPTKSTGVYKVRIQATYQSRYQKHLNSSSTLPLLSRSASPFRRPCSPADEVIELVATSAIDAVDGSSTGTSVPWMWALLRLPRFRGASD